MLKIPTLSGLFKPQQAELGPDAETNLMKNLAAIGDPQGTLNRLQSEKILATTADIKTDQLKDDYKEFALGAIQGYQESYKNMLANNKGRERLYPSGAQQLQADREYKGLITDISHLNQLTESYDETLNDAGKAFANGTITREDYNSFTKKMDDMNAAAKKSGDLNELPMAREVWNNFLHEKPDPSAVYDYKKMDAEFKQAVSTVAEDKGYEIKGSMKVNTVKVDPDPAIRDMYKNSAKFNNFWRSKADGDEELGLTYALAYGKKAKKDWETAGGNLRDSAKVSGADKNWKSQYLLSNDKVTFKSGTGGNLLVGKTLTATDGAEINAGVLFEPNYLETKADGTTVAVGVVTEKGEGGGEVIQDAASGQWYFPTSSGTVRKSVEIPYDQIRDDIIIGYAKPVGEGEFDFKKAEEYINYKPKAASNKKAVKWVKKK